MQSPRVSVIIPTFNSLAEKNGSLLYVLESLAAQKSEPFEVLVVNDCSSDGTMGEVRARYPDVRVVEPCGRPHHVGTLRNCGAKAARGSVLVFLDDDMVLHQSDTLQKVAATMDTVDFSCGADRLWTQRFWQTRVLDQPSVACRMRALREIAFLPCGINRDLGYRDLNEFTFIGCFGAVARDVFWAVGGFDEAFRGWGLEDTDLMMRLCLGGYRYALLRDQGISLVHLTHPNDTHADYARNRVLFDERERSRGHYFHVNHFFGVHEGDGTAVLTPIPGSIQHGLPSSG